nr:MAG TPA: hypothetical protein [Caudoviricetes sp.]
MVPLGTVPPLLFLFHVDSGAGVGYAGCVSSIKGFL